MGDDTKSLGTAIGTAAAIAVGAVIEAFARTGVSAEELERAKAAAIAEIASIRTDEAVQNAKEWRIVQGLES